MIKGRARGAAFFISLRIGRAHGAAFFISLRIRAALMARPFSFGTKWARRRQVLVQTVVLYITQLDWRGRVKVKSLSVIEFFRT